MTDTNSAIWELQARTALSELRARYCWYVSRGDYEQVAALYTPDGVFEFALDGKRVTCEGIEAIREELARSTFPGLVFPMIHNQVTFVAGDTAHGTCGMEAKTTVKDLPTFSGYYHDRFRVHQGQWRFTYRSYFRYYPEFERSGLDLDGSPEKGLSAQHQRTP